MLASSTERKSYLPDTSRDTVLAVVVVSVVFEVTVSLSGSAVVTVTVEAVGGRYVVVVTSVVVSRSVVVEVLTRVEIETVVTKVVTVSVWIAWFEAGGVSTIADMTVETGMKGEAWRDAAVASDLFWGS